MIISINKIPILVIYHLREICLFPLTYVLGIGLGVKVLWSRMCWREEYDEAEQSCLMSHHYLTNFMLCDFMFTFS